MFDIGFAELMIIGVVALIVIGPERLPDAVRTASAWLNRIRRGFNDIKQEVQQELHNDAVMKDLQALRDTGESLRRETEAFGSNVSNSLDIPGLKGIKANPLPDADSASAQESPLNEPAADIADGSLPDSMGGNTPGSASDHTSDNGSDNKSDNESGNESGNESDNTRDDRTERHHTDHKPGD